jgi:hypothetical protein
MPVLIPAHLHAGLSRRTSITGTARFVVPIFYIVITSLRDTSHNAEYGAARPAHPPVILCAVRIGAARSAGRHAAPDAANQRLSCHG